MFKECDELYSNDLQKYDRKFLISAYFKNKDIWEDMILPPSILLLFSFLEKFFDNLTIGDGLLI